MGYWKKHPKKDLQKILEIFDAHGWLIGDPPKYYTLRCPCGDHAMQMHLTPSGRHHGNHLLRLAKRDCPLWDKAGEEG